MSVPASTATATFTVIEHFILALIAGAAATGLAGLGLAFALEERLIELPRSWDQLDWFARKLIPFGLLGAMGLAPSYGLLRIIHGARSDADVRRFCSAPGVAVPIAAQRGAWDRVRERIQYTGYVTLMVGAILLLVGLIMLTMDNSSTRIYTIILCGVSSAITLAGWVIARRLPKPRSSDLLVPGGDFSSLDAAEKATARVIKAQVAARVEEPPGTLPGRWPWLDTLAGRLIWAGAASTGVAMLALAVGVFLRQPCKNCSSRFYDEPVELGLSVVFTIATASTVLAVLLLTIGPLLGLVTSLGTNRLVREQSSIPGIGALRPSEAVLAGVLRGPSAGRGLGTGLGMWAAAFLCFWGSAEIEAAYGHPPFYGRSWLWALVIAIVLAAGSIGLLINARREGEATAAAVRGAWPVLDPPPATQAE